MVRATLLLGDRDLYLTGDIRLLRFVPAMHSTKQFSRTQLLRIRFNVSIDNIPDEFHKFLLFSLSFLS